MRFTWRPDAIQEVMDRILENPHPQEAADDGVRG